MKTIKPTLVIVIVAALGMTLCIVGTTIAQTSDPTVAVSDATIESGETAEVEIRLTEAPNGLSGYNLTLTVADGLTGEFTSASYPSVFEITDTPRYTDLNSSVQLRAIDVQDPPGPNASDVLLATVTVEGENQGETSLTVEITRMDNDDGGKVDPSIEPGTLTVEGGSETPTPTPTPAPTPTPTPTPTSTPTSTETPTKADTSEPETANERQSDDETESVGTTSTESEPTPEDEITESVATGQAPATETVPVTDTQPDESGTNVEIEESSTIEEITFSEPADTSTASIQISESSEPASSVKSEVREAVEQSTAASPQSTEVRSVVEISPTSDSVKSSSATIQFQIERNEITNPSAIVIAHRLAEDNWELLPTSIVETSDSVVTVEATVESFSLFAIAETGSQQDATQSQGTLDSEETAPSMETPAQNNGINPILIVIAISVGVLVLVAVRQLIDSE